MLSHGIVRMTPKFIVNEVHIIQSKHHAQINLKKKHVFVSGINKVIGNIFTKNIFQQRIAHLKQCKDIKSCNMRGRISYYTYMEMQFGQWATHGSINPYGMKQQF
jgi:hypothetical protein